MSNLLPEAIQGYLPNIIQLIYLVSVVLFITGLKRLGSPATARSGNQLAAIAMLTGIVVTLFDQQIVSFNLIIIGLIVGLSSIQHAVVAELNDVGDAIGNVNQSYYYTGFSSEKLDGNGLKAYTRGSAFLDTIDPCDDDQCDIACDLPVDEGSKI